LISKKRKKDNSCVYYICLKELMVILMRDIYLFSDSPSKSKNSNTNIELPFVKNKISSKLSRILKKRQRERLKFYFHSSPTKYLYLVSAMPLLMSFFLLLYGFYSYTEETNLDASSEGLYMIIAGVVVMVISAIPFLLIKMTERKYSDPDYKRQFIDEERNIHKRINSELGIPDNFVELELITCQTENVRENYRGEPPYETELFRVWTEDGAIGVSDLKVSMIIPKSAILGYRKIEKEYAIDYWFKEEDFFEGQYKKYNIERDGSGYYRLKDYYEVLFESDDTTYILRIPCYDFPLISSITDFKCLDK